jgi:hypothetical protein
MTHPFGGYTARKPNGKRVVEPGRSMLDPALPPGSRRARTAYKGHIERHIVTPSEARRPNFFCASQSLS